ncbi:hypothetical protein SO802_023695 [Lithocarpus litseifolius]|uniref:Uncharacterized protein n=1 Tax=Lithocarpus litseifolius TaxID=425828 RepID=A0AAW2C9I2_9ROSI
MFQTLVAINQVTKQVFKENPDFFRIKPMDYGRFLVISVGTGSPMTAEKYNAKKAASADMVDVHIAVLFQALRSEHNYLRIQDDTLTGTDASVDVSTKQGYY